jgi:hypothetical protein
MATYTGVSVNIGVNAPPLMLVLEPGRDDDDGVVGAPKLGANDGGANALADLKLDGPARDGVTLEKDMPMVASKFREGVWSGLAPPYSVAPALPVCGDTPVELVVTADRAPCS